MSPGLGWGCDDELWRALFWRVWIWPSCKLLYVSRSGTLMRCVGMTSRNAKIIKYDSQLSIFTSIRSSTTITITKKGRKGVVIFIFSENRFKIKPYPHSPSSPLPQTPNPKARSRPPERPNTSSYTLNPFLREGEKGKAPEEAVIFEKESTRGSGGEVGSL